MLIYVYDWTYTVVGVVTYYIGFGITTLKGKSSCYTIYSKLLRKHYEKT